MKIKHNKKLKISDLTVIAMFVAVMAICSWISIPMTIPFTLQTFGVFMTMGVLGGKRGTLAVLVYLISGAVGVPVFAGFSGGIGYLLGSTGGFLIGFLFSAVVMWMMELLSGNKGRVSALSMVVGLLVCYTFGTIWFMVVYAKNAGTIGVWTALTWCVLPYLIPDIIKIFLAFCMCRKITRLCNWD